MGDFTHIFWDCPKLTNFWNNIQKEIKQILSININLDPALAILGIFSDDSIDRNLIYLIRILLITAKKMITASWLEPRPPSITEWTERVKNVYIMEKITARLQMKTDRFCVRWAPLTQAMPHL